MKWGKFWLRARVTDNSTLFLRAIAQRGNDGSSTGEKRTDEVSPHLEGIRNFWQVKPPVELRGKQQILARGKESTSDIDTKAGIKVSIIISEMSKDPHAKSQRKRTVDLTTVIFNVMYEISNHQNNVYDVYKYFWDFG